MEIRSASAASLVPVVARRQEASVNAVVSFESSLARLADTMKALNHKLTMSRYSPPSNRYPSAGHADMSSSWIAPATEGGGLSPNRMQRQSLSELVRSESLRSFVEGKVDTRVNEALHAFAVDNQSLSSTAPGNYKATSLSAGGGEEELQAFSGIVANLCSVVTDMSAELSSMKTAIMQPQLEEDPGRDDILASLEKAMFNVAASVQEIQRSYDSGSGLATVSSLQGALEEVQRSHKEKLDRHEAVLVDMQCLGSEVALHDSALSDLQRLQGEVSRRQRQSGDELAELREVLAETQKELRSLALVAQRLDLRLSQWRDEFAAKVEAEVRAAAGRKESKAKPDTARLEKEQYLALIATSRGEWKAHIESVREELLASMVKKEDLERTAKATRAEIARGHQELQDQFDQKHVALQRQLRDWQTKLEENLEREIENSTASRNDVRKCMEDISVEVSDTVATHSDMRARLEQLYSHFAEQMLGRSLQPPQGEAPEGGGETEHEQMAKNGAATAGEEDCDSPPKSGPSSPSQQCLRCSTWQARVERHIQAMQKQTAAEILAEVRGTLRSQAVSIANLDEQLWLTDQRLGQRIDAFWQARLAPLSAREESQSTSFRGDSESASRRNPMSSFPMHDVKAAEHMRRGATPSSMSRAAPVASDSGSRSNAAEAASAASGNTTPRAVSVGPQR